MKMTLKNFLDLPGWGQSRLARTIGQSSAVVNAWVKRQTPIYVVFDVETDTVQQVTNEKTLYQHEEA